MVEWTLVELEEAESTQSVAMELANEGAPEGTTVIAKSQSSGRGRLGREWVSPTGGLYMSFIIRPTKISRPELAAMVGAVATAEGIGETTGLNPTIRWPNDVMVSGKKLGGVVAQSQASGAEVTVIVMGIGVNCNTPISASSGVTDATSLREQLGRGVEIPIVRGGILGSFSRLYQKWHQGAEMTAQWAPRLSTVGKEVLMKLKTEETPFSASARRLESDGSLVVEHSGRTQRITPEDLEWLRERP